MEAQKRVNFSHSQGIISSQRSTFSIIHLTIHLTMHSTRLSRELAKYTETQFVKKNYSRVISPSIKEIFTQTVSFVHEAKKSCSFLSKKIQVLLMEIYFMQIKWLQQTRLRSVLFSSRFHLFLMVNFIAELEAFFPLCFLQSEKNFL